MYDGIEFTAKLQRRKKIVMSILGIKIYQVCCCCGNKIPTKWDVNYMLTGRYQVLEYDISDLFYGMVADPRRVLCNKCFGTGLWKKKGIQLRSR